MTVIHRMKYIYEIFNLKVESSPGSSFSSFLVKFSSFSSFSIKPRPNFSKIFEVPKTYSEARKLLFVVITACRLACIEVNMQNIVLKRKIRL